ncbi:hypothetical protein PUR34_03345 [Streptomyces sp. JV185]|uniref:hypothetical protein n=1 Tax=Streptomyces sp. JV185 TaxID=858638 RepID=UPI002E76FBD3|nr:hypothetical protein [Streptomyces sp. JV185]MEE1767236.1 hypothetical protein [Streptomyces sp. JV185]
MPAHAERVEGGAVLCGESAGSPADGVEPCFEHNEHTIESASGHSRAWSGLKANCRVTAGQGEAEALSRTLHTCGS